MAAPSPAPKSTQDVQEIPLQLASGSTFGRYNKISDSQTWNMIVSNDALVDYAGYRNLFDTPLIQNSAGRGLYTSSAGKIMIAVLGSSVFTINSVFQRTFVGDLETSTGDVYISENNANQIVITDKRFMYVFNFKTNPSGPLLQSLYSITVPYPAPPVGRFYAPFNAPGFLTFQNGRIIVADLGTNLWELSGINDAIQWDVSTTNSNVAYQGAISVKPTRIQACVAFPGGGNNLAIFGDTVMELWQDVGNAIFPYQRATTYNVDYGTLNASSIAALDSSIVWLSSNEQAGVTIMHVDGAAEREESISTDGIDYKLNNLTDPTNCLGFLFRQDGHLLYQFTFPTDNLSYVYDFETKLFFNVSDENQNYHIAGQVVYFNTDYYFISLNDANIYTFGTQFTNLQYSKTNIQQMPRIRILPPIRLPSQRMFICKSVAFTIENGQENYQQLSDAPVYLITQDGKLIVSQDDSYIIGQQPVTLVGKYSEAIDLRVSRDGGENFSSALRYYMNLTGNRRSRLIFQRLGQQNDLTIQIQFVGFGRFIAFDGVAEMYT